MISKQVADSTDTAHKDREVQTGREFTPANGLAFFRQLGGVSA